MRSVSHSQQNCRLWLWGCAIGALERGSSGYRLRSMWQMCKEKAVAAASALQGPSRSLTVGAVREANRTADKHCGVPAPTPLQSEGEFWVKVSPPQMRRGGAPTAGVV